MKKKLSIGILVIIILVFLFFLYNKVNDKNLVKEAVNMDELVTKILNSSNDNKNIDLLQKYLFKSPFVMDSTETQENETLVAADLILKNKILFPNYCKDAENNDCPMDYTNGIDWNYGQGVGDAHQRSFLRQLHGLFFINDLAEAYRISGNPDYIKKGYEIIMTWYKDNPFDNPRDSMAWHDEGSAQRLINMVNFFDAGSKVLADEQKLELYDIMKEHAEILAMEDFYSKNTNHGMFQDQGLIAFSKYFYEIEELNKYYLLAIERLNDYYDYILSDEFVHLEHSPAYHQVVASSIKAHAEILKGLQDTKQANHLFDIYEQMADYGTYVIKPDGEWPRIADTYEKDKPSFSMWPDNKYYQYAISSGQEGQKPTQLDKVYPDAGYAIFRDVWSGTNEGTYIFFTAAYHTSYHKHSDDLSLWIYKDQDIITESGPYSYALKDPTTIYAYSSYAHNTLIVDDEGLPRVDEKFTETYMKDYNLDNPNKPSVTGINKRYEGVIHERKLLYDKENEVVDVTDSITTDANHNFKLLWHLAPGISPKIVDNDVVTLMQDGEPIAEMKITGNVEFRITPVYGNEDSVYKSWYFSNNEQSKKIDIIDTYTIIIEYEGKDGSITTSFSL